MNIEYFNKISGMFSCLYFELYSQKELENFYTEYWGDNFLTYFGEYRSEVQENLFEIKEPTGQEAYIFTNIKLLEWTGFFEDNKEKLKEIYKNDIENQPPENKIMHKLLFYLCHIEQTLKYHCVIFNIDYYKIIKRYEKYYDSKLISPEDVYFSVTVFDKDTQPGTPNPLTPPEQTTFKSLFVAPYCLDKKINELKNILETNNFTVKGQWRGITRKGNELAYLYHYLKSNPGVIMTGDFKEQIKVFYDEFGLTVKDKLEPGVLTVTKNLTQYSTRTDTYKNFERLFIQWVQ